MKRTFFLRVLILFVAACPLAIASGPAFSAPLPPEIEDGQALNQGNQPWHASLMPYATMDEALRANRYGSSFARPLNGAWKFHWVPPPGMRSVDFYYPDFNVGNRKTIPVPPNWRVKGYGTPI